MADTVYFGPGGIKTDGGHRVYLRQLWSGSWTLYQDIHCTDAVWSCAPSMPTAQLVRPYGMVKSHLSPAYIQNSKLDVARWYVKVVFTTNATTGATMTWYGVVSDIEDHHAGFVTYNDVERPTGQQVFQCFGLEQLLNQSEISSSWYLGDIDEPEKETSAALAFNDGGRPNRTKLFRPPSDIDVFEGVSVLPAFTEHWSTRDIVKYLLYYKGPTGATTHLSRDVPFTLLHPERLDSKDSPVLQQKGATTLQLLYRLIDRRRMSSFKLTVDETTTPHTVNLVPFTFNAELIDFGLPDIDPIQPNLSTKIIVADRDEMTAISIRDVDLQLAERVLVRGAPRTTTCTFFYAADRFEQAWSTTDETAYENAASGVTGYSGWDAQKKERRNREVRLHESLKKVYSWFEIPPDWDGQTGLYSSSTVTYPCFIDDVASPVEQYVPGVRLLPYLPLYEGLDYGGSNIYDDSVGNPTQYEYRKPFCMFKVPTAAVWVQGDNLSSLVDESSDPTGAGTNYRWTATVRTQRDSRIVEINVSGEPQHVIAKTDFTPLAADRDLGDFDYKDRTMLVTVALEENRYAEAVYPDFPPDTTLIDAERTLIIYAGDEYRLDYVTEGTVVEIDNDGAPDTVAPGAYATDDRDRLAVIARLAYEWYAQYRAVLTLSTKRLTNELEVGDFVETSGDATIPNNTHLTTINSPITQIRLRNPRIQNGSGDGPSMSIVTSAGELDAATLVPPAPRRLGVKRSGPK